MSGEPGHEAFPPTGYLRPEKPARSRKGPSVPLGIAIILAGVAVSYGGVCVLAAGDSLSEVIGFWGFLGGLFVVIAGAVVCVVGAMTR